MSTMGSTAHRPGRLVVVGSLNEDFVVRVEAIPSPGQTVPGSGPEYLAGGKGANQAVAACRSGAAVGMVGAVGTDAAGDRLLAALAAAGVDAAAVLRLEGPSGVAVITVAADGENSIVVLPGANGALSPAQVADGLNDLAAGDVVLAQAEIAPECIAAAARAATSAGARFVLNLAPAVPLDLSAVPLFALLVNQHELADVAGRYGLDGDPPALTLALAERLGTAVVTTLGADGALLAPGAGSALETVAAQPVEKVVDTTGAGDAFAGAFAAALVAGRSLPDAVRWGVIAGGQAVQFEGAQGGGPIVELLSRN